ncbi:unnamed protein product, partial [Discosporangium mesarthrocarpum]
EDEPQGSEKYRELIGSLLWLANMTRPDILNAVRALARYSHDPSEQHWTGALQILSYLYGSRTLGITYLRGSGLELYAFADSSYA